MKVILIENVPNLGKKGEIKEVKANYYHNFLLPKKLATMPESSEAKIIMKEKVDKNLTEKLRIEKEEQLIKEITGKKFTFLAKADDKGRLYGSIGPKEIAEKTGIDANRINQHFKEIGDHTLKITFDNQKIVEILIEIKLDK